MVIASVKIPVCSYSWSIAVSSCLYVNTWRF